MNAEKQKWIKENAPLGATHIQESDMYVTFINPDQPEKTVKVKKPNWMIGNTKGQLKNI